MSKKIETKQEGKQKGKRGRPPLQFPDPIDDTPENIARAMFNLNPNEPGFEWQYLKDAGKPQKRK